MTGKHDLKYKIMPSIHDIRSLHWPDRTKAQHQYFIESMEDKYKRLYWNAFSDYLSSRKISIIIGCPVCNFSMKLFGRLNNKLQFDYLESIETQVEALKNSLFCSGYFNVNECPENAKLERDYSITAYGGGKL